MAVLIISLLPWDNKDYLDLLLCHTMFLSRWSLSSCCQQFKINNSVHFTATFAQKLRLKVLSWPWKQLLTKLSHHKIHLVAVLELEDRTKGRLEFFFFVFLFTWLGVSVLPTNSSSKLGLWADFTPGWEDLEDCGGLSSVEIPQWVNSSVDPNNAPD